MSRCGVDVDDENTCDRVAPQLGERHTEFLGTLLRKDYQLDDDHPAPSQLERRGVEEDEGGR
jgi:hypothetical protein